MGVLFDITDKKHSCIIEGFEIFVDNISGTNVKFRINKGTGLINLFQIKMLDDFYIDVDFTNRIGKYIIFFIHYDCIIDESEFEIGYCFLDENNNLSEINDIWKPEYLPISIFEFSRVQKLVLYSLTNMVYPSIGISLDLDYETNNYLSLGPQYSVDYKYTDDIGKIKTLFPMFSIPENYTVCGTEYIIPNRGYFLNTALQLFKKHMDSYYIPGYYPQIKEYLSILKDELI
jgi:hypothetical protein